MIVVRHGKQQPLVIVTTDQIRGRAQGEKIIQSYMSRWACEEGYRFSKLGFDLEKVQATNFNTIQNLVALAILAWRILANRQKQGKQLINKARRGRPKRPLVFPFYTLLSGWQFLFADAKTIFYNWWRKSKPLIIWDLLYSKWDVRPDIMKKMGRP